MKKPFCVKGKALIKVDLYVWADNESDAADIAISEVVGRIGSVNTNAELGRDRNDDLLHFEFKTNMAKEQRR